MYTILSKLDNIENMLQPSYRGPADEETIKKIKNLLSEKLNKLLNKLDPTITLVENVFNWNPEFVQDIIDREKRKLWIIQSESRNINELELDLRELETYMQIYCILSPKCTSRWD